MHARQSRDTLKKVINVDEDVANHQAADGVTAWHADVDDTPAGQTIAGKTNKSKVEPPPDDNMNLTRKESASKYLMSVSNVPQVLRQTSDLMLPKSYKVG